MTDLATWLTQPLRIGRKSVGKRLFMAPMAGLGHIAFRELVSAYGGYALLFSEMCSAKSVPSENRNVSPVFRWRDEELRQLVCQIFGSEPHIMATAARRVEKEGFFGIDINFGCCVAAICKQNSSAALLKDPPLAAAIVAAVRKAVALPLFVKFRTGWRDDPRIAVDLAKRLEDAGADALTFHPRVAPDRRSRLPKWEHIGRVKDAVAIPVFGNGNVFDRKDAEKMLEITGCDGISLGRIAVARPWVFAAWTENAKPGPSIYRDCILRMSRLLAQHYDMPAALRRFKKFCVYYAANFRFGHALRLSLCKATDMQQIEDIVNRFFENAPDVISRPNMNLFA